MYTMELLVVNMRSDALRWQKVWNGPNMPAHKYAMSVDWSKYKYTALLMPGIGPECFDENLSPMSKLYLRMLQSTGGRALLRLLL